MKSTKELTAELKQREGITYMNVEPYEKVKIVTGREEIEITGPVTIIFNRD